MAYQSSPLLSAISQEQTLNRQGLVADCIFPPVQTGCTFSYIDWTAELEGLKSINDHVTCKSDAKEVDTGAMKLVSARTTDRALIQPLEECCLTVCGENIDAKVAAQKTRALGNKLLIGREERAINMLTDESKYETNTGLTPSSANAKVDGGVFVITPTNFDDPNFDLLAWFQGINDNAKYGKKNVMVTDQATVNRMLRHPSFIGAGYAPVATTTVENLASYLGLSKICVADARYNDGVGETVNMTKLWPAGTIAFVSSYEFISSMDAQFSFGISAYTQGLEQNTWLDEKKGKGAGAMMQKIGHDLTEVVLSYKAATLVKIRA